MDMKKAMLKELVSMYEAAVAQMNELMEKVQHSYLIGDIQKLNEVTGQVISLHNLLVKVAFDR